MHYQVTTMIEWTKLDRRLTKKSTVQSLVQVSAIRPD
jgi:hypothetical protein